MSILCPSCREHARTPGQPLCWSCKDDALHRERRPDMAFFPRACRVHSDGSAGHMPQMQHGRTTRFKEYPE